MSQSLKQLRLTSISETLGNLTFTSEDNKSENVQSSHNIELTRKLSTN